MGQTLGKLWDWIIHIAGGKGRNDEQTLPTYCWDYHPSSTLVVEQVKEPLIRVSNSHIIATPGDEDDHEISETEHLRHNSDLWCKFSSSKEIVEEKQTVVTISEPLVMSTAVTKEHESKSKDVVEITCNPTLKPVENVLVLQKRVSAQPKTVDKMIRHYLSSYDHEISETEHLGHISDLWCKLTSSKEIVEEKQSVITISQPLVMSTAVTKERESKSKGVVEITCNAPLEPVENVVVLQKKVSAQPKTIDKMIGHYRSSHTILLVGDGDFSFSACLAKAFGSASNMVATSRDSLDFLRENYPSAVSNIGYLRNNGAIVIHNVDATQMADHDDLYSLRFDRVIFNFPLAGFFVESKKQKLKRNQKLVRLFMKNAASMLEDKGEIHITHKSSSSYREWDLEGLARHNHLRLIEDVEFKLSRYRGYHNKYGFGGNANFNCCPSRTYKFGRK